jgi:hypothetical protein
MVILLISSCNDDEAVPQPSGDCDETAILDHDRYVKSPDGMYAILEASIADDCLTIKFGASGCDGSSWTIGLIDSEDVIEPQPPQRFIKLELENLETCLAFFTTEVSFDIRNLQVDGNEVILNLKNFDTPISYKY